MARKTKTRVVYDVQSDTPANQRWFRRMVANSDCASWDDNGYTVTNESKWAELLSVSNSQEVSKP